MKQEYFLMPIYQGWSIFTCLLAEDEGVDKLVTDITVIVFMLVYFSVLCVFDEIGGGGRGGGLTCVYV